MKRVVINGTPAVQMKLGVRVGAFSNARFATRSQGPASTTFTHLMGILEGHLVEATVFSGANVSGTTSEAQLRAAYEKLSPERRFWIKEAQLEEVISRFGDGQLGFDMSGIYCAMNPADIEAEIAKVPLAA